MKGEYSAASSFSHGKPATTAISLRGPAPTVRSVAQKNKRVKLRARELARHQCHNLELDLLNLKQEIATLETTRRLLYARTLNRADAPMLGSYERIIREFYAIGHAGYERVVRRRDARSELVDMLQFMRTCFDDSLAVGAHSPMTPGGLDLFLAALEQMTAELHSMKATVLSLNVRTSEAGDAATVTVKSRCASILGAAMLDKLFPHLSTWFPWLRTKLIGRELVTIVSGEFTFSTRHGRVVRVDLHQDRISTILKLAESTKERQILEGKWAPCSDAVEVLIGDELGFDEDGAKHDEEASDRESKLPSGSRSPMSLQYVLSPEQEDDNQSDAESEPATSWSGGSSNSSKIQRATHVNSTMD